jgi:glutamine amidotransferase
MGAAEIVDGLRSFLSTILDIKRRHDNRKVAKLKFFLADGNDLVVANIGLGTDYATTIDASWDELHASATPGTEEHTLAGVLEPVWYMAGDNYSDFEGTYEMTQAQGDRASTVIVASEPLTENAEAWTRIPFQHVAYFHRDGASCTARLDRLEIDA